MAALVLGRKYISDPAYGGTICLHRIRTNANPETFDVAPVDRAGSVSIVSQVDPNGNVVPKVLPFATITVNANNPTDNGLITIAGIEYTLQSALTASTTAYEILISNTETIMALAIVDAVNANPATAGVSFGSLTPPNPYVSAALSPTDSKVVVLTARASSGAGTAITLTKTTDTSTGFTLSGATFSGGSVNGASAIATAPAVTITGDRVTSKSTVTLSGVAIGSEVVVMTVHGDRAGINSAAIG